MKLLFFAIALGVVATACSDSSRRTLTGTATATGAATVEAQAGLTPAGGGSPVGTGLNVRSGPATGDLRLPKLDGVSPVQGTPNDISGAVPRAGGKSGTARRHRGRARVMTLVRLQRHHAGLWGPNNPSGSFPRVFVV